MNTTILDQLPAKTQGEVLEVLTCYDRCSVDFYNGKYHVHIGCGLQDKYPDDFRFVGVINNFDVYTPEQMKENYRNM